MFSLEVPNHAYHQTVKSSWFLILILWDFILFNHVNVIISQFALLSFLVFLCLICESMFIIFGVTQFPLLPTAVTFFFGITPVWHVKFFPAGLLICRPCTVKDENNIFLVKASKTYLGLKKISWRRVEFGRSWRVVSEIIQKAVV